jgi:hypothetical protein
LKLKLDGLIASVVGWTTRVTGTVRGELLASGEVIVMVAL